MTQSWTKVTKKEAQSTGGFLQGLGFLVQGFLSPTSGFWTKITKDTQSWTKVTQDTQSWTKVTKDS